MKASPPIGLVEVNEGNEGYLPPIVFFANIWVFYTTPLFYLHNLHTHALKHYLSRQETMNLRKKITFIDDILPSFHHFDT